MQSTDNANTSCFNIIFHIPNCGICRVLHRGTGESRYAGMEQARFADTARATRHMFIRDLVLNASIGVHQHEHLARQRVRINIDLAVTDDGAAANISRASVGHDDLARVVDYETIVNTVRDLVATGHVQLVETLAERLAEACLVDSRIRIIRVRVEKLDVFAQAASAGVEVERRNK